MESLKELYRVGPGPSSSHTLGVQRACLYYKNHYPQAIDFVVELFGSLGLTGHGHMTEGIIQQVFGPEHVIIKFYKEIYLQENSMVFHTVKDGQLADEMVIFSTGGGAIAINGQPPLANPNVYPDDHISDILQVCHEHSWSLADYAFYYDQTLKPYLAMILQKMLEVIKSGLSSSGVLPGALEIPKVAKRLYSMATGCDDPLVRQRLLITSYAYAAMEENACGHTSVTAPTLGSCGVVSSMVMYHYENGMDRRRLINGLAIAGLFGNVIKTRATISGATGGCQAEIGTACAMAAALNAYLAGLSNKLISYAAEIGMEHNLGMTCDPVGGYVQIPCIERNGVAALRSYDAAVYAKYLGSIRDNRISFDMVVDTMNYTGHKLARELRETSLGGLALALPVADKAENNRK